MEPDLFVVTGDQAGILTEKNVQGPPALVIEVLVFRPSPKGKLARAVELAAEDGGMLITLRAQGLRMPGERLAHEVS